MIQEALAEIKRGTAEIIDEEKIVELLKEYFNSGKEYYVKAGFDPTAPDLHLGHTVLLQKLATFQKYGGIVQFIIGDFTAMIGDPTGKSETRKKLDRETVLKNATSYKEQVFKVLDPAKTQVVFNSKWLDALGASGLVELTTLFSVARMLERDDFEKRFKSNKPIAISEFIYPLLQGYDSVHLKSDIEIGGTDQKFNLLMGRHLQRSYGLGKEQAVLMMPILEGLDGVQKMSKSLGNYIGVTEDPNTMFAKLLSISDELMWRYYELLSSKSLEEIKALKEGVSTGQIHPKAAKELLAMEIVARYHNSEAAKAAKAEFDKIHKQKDIPSDLKEVELQGPIWIAKALVEAGLEPSTSQARRDIQAGAVRLDKEKVQDKDLQLQSGEYIAQVGKRKFAKLKVL
ncbi:tyrosyl-tRNA synthetase [Nitratiruptor sp. YY08-26]|uniref:tyrosine--tRNA ligase n=1 Tax=unclassified Nitratiruptor TaxID=2624044 RepID=UPI001915567B|nr:MULTISPECIES: tyrosine--tRNA ligase [unclassified Nitratiruptor]BCD62111.1 tyrosyl-tRNA synthetase [Nitratiruptor sp. YY08-13]BCD66047.1 tyrosyl-tRNA synthetase [Nitratiruptor sp. YY08-26]